MYCPKCKITVGQEWRNCPQCDTILRDSAATVDAPAKRLTNKQQRRKERLEAMAALKGKATRV